MLWYQGSHKGKTVIGNQIGMSLLETLDETARDLGILRDSSEKAERERETMKADLETLKSQMLCAFKRIETLELGHQLRTSIRIRFLVNVESRRMGKTDYNEALLLQGNAKAHEGDILLDAETFEYWDPPRISTFEWIYGIQPSAVLQYCQKTSNRDLFDSLNEKATRIVKGQTVPQSVQLNVQRSLKRIQKMLSDENKSISGKN